MKGKSDEPAKPGKPGKSGTGPDIATFAGLLIAAGSIVGGFILEGGTAHQILHATSALIVLGGTIGAVLISTPMGTVIGSVKRIKQILFQPSDDTHKLVEEIIGYATRARKSGLVSLEDEAEKAGDPFLKKALNLAVDGSDLHEVRKMMELEISLDESRSEAEAKVFDAAGGYAPTIGIIGAVLGLIQVMTNLSDVEKVGPGIASAFVATIYGVAIANLWLLPGASKIRARGSKESQQREMILEGVAGIVEGLNPKLIRSKLEAFLVTKPPVAKGAPASEKKEAA